MTYALDWRSGIKGRVGRIHTAPTTLQLGTNRKYVLKFRKKHLSMRYSIDLLINTLKSKVLVINKQEWVLLPR